MPGLRKEEVQLVARDNQLFISGERRPLLFSDDSGRTLVNELKFGRFERAIPLPPGTEVCDCVSLSPTSCLILRVLSSHLAYQPRWMMACLPYPGPYAHRLTKKRSDGLKLSIMINIPIPGSRLLSCTWFFRGFHSIEGLLSVHSRCIPALLLVSHCDENYHVLLHYVCTSTLFCSATIGFLMYPYCIPAQLFSMLNFTIIFILYPLIVNNVSAVNTSLRKDSSLSCIRSACKSK